MIALAKAAGAARRRRRARSAALRRATISPPAPTSWSLAKANRRSKSCCRRCWRTVARRRCECVVGRLVVDPRHRRSRPVTVRSCARRRATCCPISIAQPFPDRAAIDLPAYLSAWRARHGVRPGVADHRARLSLHLHVVQPLGVRHNASPPFGGERRRRSRGDRRSLSPRSAVVRRRRVRHPSRVDARLCARSSSGGGCACRSSASRAPSASTTRGRRAGEPGLLARVDRIGKRIAARSRRDAAQGVGRAGARTPPRGCAAAAFRSACSSCSATTASDMTDLRATVEHLKRTAPDVFLTTVSYPIKGTPYYDTRRRSAGRRRSRGCERTDRDLVIARAAGAALLRLRAAVDDRRSGARPALAAAAAMRARRARHRPRWSAASA